MKKLTLAVLLGSMAASMSGCLMKPSDCVGSYFYDTGEFDSDTFTPIIYVISLKEDGSCSSGRCTSHEYPDDGWLLHGKWKIGTDNVHIIVDQEDGSQNTIYGTLNDSFTEMYIQSQDGTETLTLAKD